MFTLADLENVITLVRASVAPTPQYAWPLLKLLTGVDVVVKHENHTPIWGFQGARWHYLFWPTQARAITGQGHRYGDARQPRPVAGLRRRAGWCCCDNRGAARQLDRKNASMQSFGAKLIEHGRDFDEAKEAAIRIARERRLEYAPSFHRDFVIGVATYAHELFSAIDDLNSVYVPIGLGSGICGLVGTRDAFGLKTKIVGVVSKAANAYHSF